MRLSRSHEKRNRQGLIEALITLSHEGVPLYEDYICLSKEHQKVNYLNTITGKFPSINFKDADAQLRGLLNDIYEEEDTQGFIGEKPTSDGDGSGGEGKLTAADKLLKLVLSQNWEFFHTPMQVAYARIKKGDYYQLHKCRSQSMKHMAGYLYYQEIGRVPNSDAINSVINAMEGLAFFEGPCHELHNRVAWHDKAIFYDLTDYGYRSVRIDKYGWELQELSPILFYRYAHQSPQVEPKPGGDIRDTLKYVNLMPDSPDEELLLLVYLVACFIPDIAHPIIHLYGGQGSAKSTLFRLLVSLIDPSDEDLLIPPTSDTELAQKLNQHWMCAFDNLGTVAPWLSDMFSRAVTGTGFSKRELYTDDGAVIYKIKRVIGLNGINIVANKPDLLDRCLLFELCRIQPSQRREEAVVMAEFNKDKPALLGAIFDVLSTAQRIMPEVQLKELPRLADFGRWGEAIARALGYQPYEFVAAYNRNIECQTEEVITSNPIAICLMEYLDSPSFLNQPVDMLGGRLIAPSELLSELIIIADRLNIQHKKIKSWPKTPSLLTRRLNELKVSFRSSGVLIETGMKVGRGDKRERKIRFCEIPLEQKSQDTKNGVPADPAVPTTPDGANSVAENYSLLPDGTGDGTMSFGDGYDDGHCEIGSGDGNGDGGVGTENNADPTLHDQPHTQRGRGDGGDAIFLKEREMEKRKNGESPISQRFACPTCGLDDCRDGEREGSVICNICWPAAPKKSQDPKTMHAEKIIGGDNCVNCGEDNWWFRADGGKVCAKCHPKPLNMSNNYS